MRILIVDDHPLIVEGLITSLRDLDPLLEVSCAQDGGEAVAALSTEANFDLILLDLTIPDTRGLELLDRIRLLRPDVPLVVLSANDHPDTVRATLDGGAMGFISKRSSTEVLLRALQLVLSGGIYVPPQVLLYDQPPETRGPSPALSDFGLTDRQVEVLALLVEGKANKVISRELDISAATVKSHLSSIFRALRVANRTQVLIALSRLGVQLPTLCRRAPH